MPCSVCPYLTRTVTLCFHEDLPAAVVGFLKIESAIDLVMHRITLDVDRNLPKGPARCSIELAGPCCRVYKLNRESETLIRWDQWSSKLNASMTHKSLDPFLKPSSMFSSRLSPPTHPSLCISPSFSRRETDNINENSLFSDTLCWRAGCNRGCDGDTIAAATTFRLTGTTSLMARLGGGVHVLFF